MPDWVLKILHQAINVKRAWQMLVAVIFMVWVWPKAISLATSQGMEAEIYIPFTVLFSICFGFVTIEVITFLSNKISLSHKAYRERAENFKKRQQIVEAFRVALPNLPGKQFIILVALKDQQRKFNSEDSNVYWLEKAGYIERMVQLEYNNYMYRINSQVVPELEAFLAFKKQKHETTENA